MKKITVIVMAVLMTGCFAARKNKHSESTTTNTSTTTTGSTTTNAAGLSQADADRGAAKFPGYTLTDLTQGKQLYGSHCGTCHALKSPTSESEAEWRRIVPEMVKKANRKGQVIDAHAEEMILKYAITMSGK